MYQDYLKKSFFFKLCTKLFWTKKLKRKLLEINPDVIISTQVGPTSVIAEHKDLFDAKLGGERFNIDEICEYAEKWKFKPKTIKSMINEAIVYLHQIHAGNTVEEMRSEQVSKLEDLYKDATISEKLKIIDLVSSTLGLYDNKLTVKQEDEIKINLGI